MTDKCEPDQEPRELTWHLDSTLGNWLKEARNVLAGRGQLELIREFPLSVSASAAGPRRESSGALLLLADQAFRSPFVIFSARCNQRMAGRLGTDE